MSDSRSNPEMRDLKTHQAGSATLHETRTTAKPVLIEEADAPGPISENKTRS
ncbi:hypothetical protein J19TS2_22130 [Cohnella xylanilytica]|uniref:Uncharacterized protein n=1 Tax=Cohnella xylanilytica TaxID=557555 RepID=A0A841UCB3_9BACL|nr:hypothetical protein [Cohnella xylanilytica]MBB6695550.1 hypothetical protein [Cohnella xylanilytica]GIO12658.1 hypothetical protein J19TS2_22130 [Cohnella xylanilytica]